MVKSIRTNINPACDHTGKLHKDGCTVLKKNFPQIRIVINFNKLKPCPKENNTRCDFLFAADVAGEDSWIVPLQLKKGRSKVDEVVKQLQAGATATERLVSRDRKVRFCPILANGSGTHKELRNKLKKPNCKIRFHNQFETIRLMNCGGSLMDTLKKKT